MKLNRSNIITQYVLGTNKISWVKQMLHMEDKINKQYIWRTQEEHKEMEKDQTWISNTRPIFIASTENKDQTKGGYDCWIGNNATSSLPFFLKFFFFNPKFSPPFPKHVQANPLYVKSRIYIYIKATINTYNKKNPILASKHT